MPASRLRETEPVDCPDGSSTSGEPPRGGLTQRKRKLSASLADSERSIVTSPAGRKTIDEIWQSVEVRRKLYGYLICLGLPQIYTSADIARLLASLYHKGILREPIQVADLEDIKSPRVSRAIDLLGQITVHVAYLGAEVNPSISDRSQSQDSTICEQCRRLRLSYIFGHDDAILEDRDHFLAHSRVAMSLAHVQRNCGRCRVCQFLRECISIEQSNGNPSKPRFKPLGASEFCGLRSRRSRRGFVDVPCLVFALKKQDRQGCILPVGSPHRAATIIGREVEPNKINFDVVAHWLSFCKKRHGGQCRPLDTKHTYSLKVIDCHTRKIIAVPSQEAEYLALSYVWGPSPEVCSDDNSSLPKVVPKVIEDAIVVTKVLGFRFLWVDRYCIPLDDEREKHSQLKNMGRIYAQSALTIISTGDGPEYGLPGVTSTSRTRQPSLRWGKEQLVYCLTKGARRELHSSIWNTRGWTYQEGLLSRRRLVFTERQVYFQCQAMHQNETIATQLNDVQARSVFPLSIDFGFAFPAFQELQDGVKSLQNRVHEFVHRRFTFDSEDLLLCSCFSLRNYMGR